MFVGALERLSPDSLVSRSGSISRNGNVHVLFLTQASDWGMIEDA